MPFYDYECSECKHEWEEFHSMTAEPSKQCPKCQQETAKRLISKSNFILVGGGWADSGYSNK